MERAILFAHHDPEDRVRSYVLRHLEALRELGGRIRFISNASLSPAELEKVAPLAEATLLRENRGFDFGMWKDAIRDLDLRALDELVLANSSVIGPNRPLDAVFRRMDAMPCDFWGMTESQEHGFHLQSFFLVFRKPVLASPVLSQFFESVLPYKDKSRVVHAYELGMTRFLEEHGFRCAAAFPLRRGWCPLFQNLAFRRSPFPLVRRKRNPTLEYPDLLIRAGMPYLKIALLVDNPRRIRLEPLRAMALREGFDLDLTS